MDPCYIKCYSQIKLKSKKCDYYDLKLLVPIVLPVKIVSLLWMLSYQLSFSYVLWVFAGTQPLMIQWEIVDTGEENVGKMGNPMLSGTPSPSFSTDLSEDENTTLIRWDRDFPGSCQVFLNTSYSLTNFGNVHIASRVLCKLEHFRTKFPLVLPLVHVLVVMGARGWNLDCHEDSDKVPLMGLRFHPYST